MRAKCHREWLVGQQETDKAAQLRAKCCTHPAGAMAPAERLLQFKIETSLSVEDFWALRSEMSEKLREKLAKLSREQASEVKHQMLEALRGYSTDGEMSFPAEVLIISGTRSRPT